jgi:hypothetical protein
MNDVAQGCWEAIDEIAPGEKAILVGCSVGSAMSFSRRRLAPRDQQYGTVCVAP